jgi:hypothetical protein
MIYRTGDRLFLFGGTNKANIRTAYWALCTRRFGNVAPRVGESYAWSGSVAEARIAMVLNERYRQRVQPAT